MNRPFSISLWINPSSVLGSNFIQLISLTYSSVNGYTLYFNGHYFGATGNVVHIAEGTLTTLFVAFFTSCNLGNGAVNAAFQGSMNEVYVHNRELILLHLQMRDSHFSILFRIYLPFFSHFFV